MLLPGCHLRQSGGSRRPEGLGSWPSGEGEPAAPPRTAVGTGGGWVPLAEAPWRLRSGRGVVLGLAAAWEGSKSLPAGWRLGETQRHRETCRGREEAGLRTRKREAWKEKRQALAPWKYSPPRPEQKAGMATSPVSTGVGVRRGLPSQACTAQGDLVTPSQAWAPHLPCEGQ